MKRILIAFILIIGLSIINKLEAQTTKFYYYPASDVYFNTVSEEYIYNNNGRWTTVKTLPKDHAVDSKRVIVYSSSNQVWTNNGNHKAKYKAAKIKPVSPGKLKAINKRQNKQA